MSFTTFLLFLSIVGNIYLGLQFIKKTQEQKNFEGNLEIHLYKAFEDFIKDELKEILKELKKKRKEKKEETIE